MKFLLMGFFICLAATANAKRYDIQGKISQVRYHEAASTLAPEWHKLVWFTIKDANHNPDCRTNDGEYSIVIPTNNESALSMVLAAKMSDSDILVTIDDSRKITSSNYCVLEYFTIR
ncbi:hypothetical protein P886_0178 [Alteromonadaceae bacterium 2753L.S.0a.02]|nr:hypothetical protein P886_0178 [Alteromonadaceae bacterium 2753L.S.0a.02]